MADVIWDLIRIFFQFSQVINTSWILQSIIRILGFPCGASGKEPFYRSRRYRRCCLDSRVRKIPWKRMWQPTLVFFPGESHGQRSLAGYSPWDHKELDTTGWLTLFKLQGSPLPKLEEPHKYRIIVKSLNHVWLSVTVRAVACQAPLSSTISWSWFKFMSVELVVLTISSSAI